MGTAEATIQLPPPSVIQQRLADAVAEARALRRLLKLAKAADQVQAIRNRARQSENDKEDRAMLNTATIRGKFAQ